MKSLKFTSFIIVSLLACVGYAQDAKPAVEIPTAVTIEDRNKDRSYVEDFADKPATITQVDKSGTKETPMTLKSVSSKEFILVDASGGELAVPKKTDAYKFTVKPDSNWQRARNAFSSGDWNEAIVYLRPTVYPVLAFTAFSEDACARVHGLVEMYITALLNANRLNEAKALVLALPLNDIPAQLLSSVIGVGEALAAENRLNDAIALANRINFDDSNMAAMSDMMAFLGSLRKMGATKECSLWYTKLSNIEKNPSKDEAKMWMVYCDLQMGNKMSAEVFLSGMKVDRNSESFSLLQMIKGMLKSTGDKPNYSEALDLYAEGIVFGSLSSPWMPELLFDAGMTYKKLGKFIPANEIFAQMAALYPNDPLAVKGLKEVVKVEKKVKKKVVDEDEDEDEDEEDE